MRSTFDIDQSIALVEGRNYFDLHNCFDFISYQYLPSERAIKLIWKRSSSDWISDKLPFHVFLLFEGVSNFAVIQRDHDMPFSEDKCLASISFLPPELDNEFGVVCPDFRSNDEHFDISFQSGAALKIWANSVSLLTSNNVEQGVAPNGTSVPVGSGSDFQSVSTLYFEVGVVLP